MKNLALLVVTIACVGAACSRCPESQTQEPPAKNKVITCIYTSYIFEVHRIEYGGKVYIANSRGGIIQEK